MVFANLKTWIHAIHHGVSAKHLQAYLNQFTFRFNRLLHPFNSFRSLLGIADEAAAPTYDGLCSAEWAQANQRPSAEIAKRLDRASSGRAVAPEPFRKPKPL